MWNSKGRTEWPVYDLGGFGMALMLAAKDAGVDSIPAHEVVKHPAELRPLLGAQADEDIVMGIALGYAPDGELNGLASTRLPLEEDFDHEKVDDKRVYHALRWGHQPPALRDCRWLSAGYARVLAQPLPLLCR